MSPQPSNGPSSPQQTDDEMTVIFTALGFLGTIGALALWGWQKITTWLLEHQVLLPASDQPSVVVPYTDGAGLDIARVSLLVGAVIATLALAGAAVRRHRRRSRQEIA